MQRTLHRSIMLFIDIVNAYTSIMEMAITLSGRHKALHPMAFLSTIEVMLSTLETHKCFKSSSDLACRDILGTT